MTKVNYFQITGTRNGANEQELVYARSKNEAVRLSNILGLSDGSVEATKEMNYKTELIGRYTPQQLFDIRVRDKIVWKQESNKTKEKKVKQSKKEL